MSTFTSINIETLILVAVWEKPFVFQGCFKLTDKSKHKQRLLFFRCECDKTDKKELIEQAFSAYEYQFSHLYDGAQPIRLSERSKTDEHALYLLKYALHITLQKMLTSNKQYLLSIDEVALQAITKQIEPILHQRSWSTEENDLGFAVTMDFNPYEESGQKAVLFLLEKENPMKPDNYALH